MYIKKGKPYFGRKDTWSMDGVLAPIIAAGITKFKDDWCSKSPMAGLNGILTTECIDTGMVSYIDDYAYSPDDWRKMEQVYVYMLDEMIYAFGSEEPDWIDIQELLDYHKRCDQGRMWFAKYYHSLWI
ncbi:hypothetical protein S14_76 [Shewanella sp. phage 1/4]|uniref:hypothetical protein n=1 Tax=Shewanella phage 1/4 TaxID=1458859 RepID=UPI0004F5E4D9|nr:hypothetical protein S14_76 [Shewanella sp. phage 1/4]AHK11188.1 hypothetical protein S14_76 [Shewanella sp. phage 1/4]